MPGKNKIKCIIFDFDGVLADSFDALYRLVRDSMAYVGFALTPDRYRSFFVGNVHQSVRNFINDEDKYNNFSKFRKSNYDKYYNAELYPGAAEFIEKAGKNHILTIVSSGELKNMTDLLKKNYVEHLFSLILANAAHSKESMIKETMDKFGKTAKETIMITDTAGDILTAKKNGSKSGSRNLGISFAGCIEKN